MRHLRDEVPTWNGASSRQRRRRFTCHMSSATLRQAFMIGEHIARIVGRGIGHADGAGTAACAAMPIG
ncbi:hypothetical protein J3R03_008952 [Actinoplanes couchii]|nr:hypothetical protein [Actinoplanes couchii]